MGEGLEADEANPLLALLGRCTVRIDVGETFRGTGFFVAPGEVLTCAHVIHSTTSLTVGWSDGDTCSAAVVTALPALEPGDPAANFHPLPDVALLRLENAPVDHPCVHLQILEPVAGLRPDALHLAAYTKGEHAADTVVATNAGLLYEGPLDEDGWRLLKFKGGQVVGGFSGGPLLNLRTGAVCGVADSSRSERSDLGGFGVPVAAFLDDLPGLLERNQAHHLADRRWGLAVEQERAREAVRAGLRERLPLLTPTADLEWDREQDPASDLLRPRHAVVPFVGRERLLDELMLWREADSPLAVAVLAGGGGSGKTRTAVELSGQAERAGWTAGLLDSGARGQVERLEELIGWPGRLLVVVDYAETRPELVADLLGRLGRRGAAARVVLVVRQTLERRRLEELFTLGDGKEELTGLLRRAEFVRLDSREQELDRAALFEQAASAFTALLEGRPWQGVVPRLRADHFARPMLVVSAALLAAGDPALDIAAMSAAELMEEILDRHEARHWQRWNDRLDAGLAPEDQRRAVAVAGLLGGDTEAEAVAVARLVPGLGRADDERVRKVTRWLARLYGDGRLDTQPTIVSLEPDLLAEALIARELTGTPTLLGNALEQAGDSQLARALVVLSRAAAVREQLADLAREALDVRLPQIVANLSAQQGQPSALVAATRQAVLTLRPAAGALTSLDEVSEARGALAPLAADIMWLAVEALRFIAKQKTEPWSPDLGAALSSLSSLLADLGRRSEALDAITEAVAIRRAVAETATEGRLLDLTGSLNNLSLRLTDEGRDEEALDAATEAVTIHRRLGEAVLDRRLDSLATCLSTLSNCLGTLGRGGEALDAITQAVTICRALAEATPDRWPDLARVLDNQSIRLGDLGRGSEALDAAVEAVGIRRELVEIAPDRWLPDLARSLINLSRSLAALGRIGEASDAVNESLVLYERLAEAVPERWLPELAVALTNHSGLLADLGRTFEALDANTEAVAIRREQAEAAPERWLPDLGAALTNQCLLLTDLGRTVEALDVSAEAVMLYRPLAAAAPERWLPQLAMALTNQSLPLTDSGRTAEALDVLTEAITYYRQLAEAVPERWLPELAVALNNQSLRLRDIGGTVEALDVGRTFEALDVIIEVVAIRRELAEAVPERWLPGLAVALNNQSLVLGDLGWVGEALDVSSEAVTLHRRLAEAAPERWVPDLALSLNNKVRPLVGLGRIAEALDVITEAAALYKRAAEAAPDRWLPELAASLHNQSLLLVDLGRGREAERNLAALLRAFEHHPWAVGVLLLTRSHWHAGQGALTPALRDGWDAVQRLPLDRDPLRRAQARSHLRQLRRQYSRGFDQAWDDGVGVAQPLWLRHAEAEDDQAVRRQLTQWIDTATWPDSQAFLTAHADALLSDQAEGALEHLIDEFPGESTRPLHLRLLQDARRDGVDPAYLAMHTTRRGEMLTDLLITWVDTNTWQQSRQFLDEYGDELLTDDAETLLHTLFDANPDHPDRLTHLGLLALCRLHGLEQAYGLLSQAGAAPTQPPPASPRDWLALVRLRAGLNPDDSDSLYEHAVVALMSEMPAEAEQAIARFAQNTPTWDRPSYARHLHELAVLHPQLTEGLARLRAALTEPHP